MQERQSKPLVFLIGVNTHFHSPRLAASNVSFLILFGPVRLIYRGDCAISSLFLWEG